MYCEGFLMPIVYGYRCSVEMLLTHIDHIKIFMYFFLSAIVNCIIACITLRMILVYQPPGLKTTQLTLIFSGENDSPVFTRHLPTETCPCNTRRL